MEPWLIFGILGYLAYAISTSLDKVFLNHKYSPLGINLYKMLFNGLILLLIGSIFFSFHITTRLLFFSLILGSIYALASILYYYSLKVTDATVFVSHYQALSILFSFLGTLIIFSEPASALNFTGLALIILGIYLLLLKGTSSIPKIDHGFLYIILSALVFLAYALLSKRFLFDTTPIELATLMYLASAIFIAIYIALKKRRKAFSLKHAKIAISSVFGALGTFAIFFALTKGYASRVFAIAGISSAGVFLIAAIFLKEKSSWKRLLGTLTIILGIYLVAM
ncbi:MAG: DMT family transporter [Nanoarchaeota archaeon]